MSRPGDSINVLHVDDDPAFIDMTGAFLEREDARFTIQTATTVADGLNELAETRIDCIVSDYEMPGRTGIEFLETVRAEYPDLPFILFTGKGSEEVAADAISAGVSDYLQKGGTERYTLLANRIQNLVEQYRNGQAVDRAQERFRILVEQTTDVIFVVDTNGVIQYATPSAESVLGRTPAELVGTSGFDPIHPSDRDRVMSVFAELIESPGEYQSVEFRYERPDGTTIWIEARGRNLLKNETINGIVVYTRDITERKQREQAQIKTERILTALHDVASELVTSETAARICQRTVATAEELLEFDLSVIALEDAGVLTVEAASDDLPPDMYDSMGVNEGIAGRTYRTGTTYLVNDIDDDPDAKPQGPFRSVLSLPIGDHGNFQAVAEAPDAFDDDDMRLAELLISHTKNALDRLTHEHRLERERDRRAALFDNVPDPIARVTFRNGTSIFEEINSAFETTFGYDPEEVLGATPNSLTVPPGLEPESDAIDQQVQRGNVIEREIQRETTDGVKEFLFRGIPIDTGQQNDEAYGIYVDVSDQRKHTAALETLHSITGDLIEAETEQEIADRLVAAAENILDFPLAMVRRYDQDEGGLVPVSSSDRIDDLIGDRPVFEENGGSLNWEVFETGTAQVFDDVKEIDRAIDSDTGLRSLMILPLGSFGTLSAGALTTGTFDENDVSLAGILATSAATALSRIQHERELVRQRDQLKRQSKRAEEFASIVSHDLRNPLSVAMGNLELARADCESDRLDAVAASHDRMETLIDDLLKLAQHGSTISELSSVDVGSVATRAWKNVETANATLEIESTIVIYADDGRLQQLLENLFRNAIEHGRQDVVVRIGELQSGFFVEDDGPGIPANRRERVFESGYSTTDDGTGFGLAIVKEIADAHGWDITIPEREDGGARFEITGVDRPD